MSLVDHRSGVHHCVVTADIVAYSHPDRDQGQLQQSLVDVLTAAAAVAGVPIPSWERQAGGDSILAVLPAGISETAFIPAFVTALTGQLGRRNHEADERLRLRVAIHHGYVNWAANGWSDQTVVDVCRMRDAYQTRLAMDGNPESDFVLAVSRSIHDGVPWPDPIRFWAVVLETKDRELHGFLHVPIPAATVDRPADMAIVAPRRHAVVVGVGHFGGRLAELPTATDAAVRLHVALRDTGYASATVAINPDGTALRTAIEQAREAALTASTVVVSAVGRAEVGSRGRVRLVPSSALVSTPQPPGPDLDAFLDEVEEAQNAAATLLVLDTTHADALIARRVGRGRTWTMAAIGSSDGDVGALASALATVLHRLRQGEIDLDESVAHLPVDRVRDEVRRVLYERAGSVAVETVEGLGSPAFFTNPRYEPGARRPSGDVGVFQAVIDEVDRRGGVRGRVGVLTQGRAWLAGNGPPLLFVTGRAGIGKTVVVSALAAGAHPALGGVPDPDRPIALLSLTGRGVADASAALRRQLDPGVRHSADDLDLLLELCQGMPAAPLVLVDALDEASDPGAVEATLLRPLVATGAGRAACRLLVGGRPDPRWRPLHAIAAHEIVDLDESQDPRLRDDLADYVELTMADASWDQVPRRAFAEAVATALVGARPDVGEFLLAGAYGHYVAARWPAVSATEVAAQLGASVPVRVVDLLRLDLARPETSPMLLPLLAAVADAPSAGAPLSMLFRTAHDLRSGTDAQLRQALAQAGFYLRRSVDEADGRPLFQLYHASLVELLRRDPLLEVAG